MPTTFISYSRKQLYFAEAIALHLQKAGIDVWFDLQQLSAGSDWASTLKQGYERCERLVLVVSQSALESKYVEVEWATARKNGREVILAVIEDVSLPEALRDCATIDFRTNFKSAMKRLASTLNGSLPLPKDRISAPGRFPYSLHLPPAIWFTILSLLWPYLWMLGMSLSALKDFPGQGLSYFVFGAIALGVLAFAAGVHPFWKHNLDQRGVRNLGAFAVILQMILMFVALASLSPLKWAVVLCLMLNVYFYFWFSKRSPALLRWFAAGQASQQLRRHCHAKLAGNAQLNEEVIQAQPVDFSLQHDPADAPMANHIIEIMAQAGHRRVADAKSAQKQLYLITNRASQSTVEAATKDGTANDIFLLGSSINWSASLDGAGKTQFVDLREHDVNDIKVFAASLSNMDLWRRQSALEATPTKFEAYTAPSSVQTLRFLAYLQVMSFLSTAALQVYAGAWVGALIPLVFGLVLFFMTERILERKVPFLGTLAFVGGLPLLFAAINQQTPFAIPNLLLVAWVMYGGRFWFPAQAPTTLDAIGMDKDGKNRRWGWVFVAITTLISLTISLLR